MARFPRVPSLWNLRARVKPNVTISSGSKVTGTVVIIVLVLYLGVLVVHQVNVNNVRALQQRKAGGVVFVPAAVDSSHRWDGSGSSSWQYGVVVDAGSSGSRVYVYIWPKHSGDPDTLLDIQPLRSKSDGNPVVMKIEPGLSSNAQTPNKSSQYLRPLLEFAEQHIPSDKHRETPLYILATAGMRLLSKQQQDDILNNLRREIAKQHKFLFSDTHAEVISGKQEGVYQWIATNYILDKLPHTHQEGSRQDHGNISASSMKKRSHTVGVIDMGGGSVQVAFEVNDTAGIPKELIAEINLGCSEHNSQHVYKLYVVTYLGFGANIARSRYETALIKQYAKLAKQEAAANNRSASLPKGFIKGKPIPDPCLPYKMPFKSAHSDLQLDGVLTTSEPKTSEQYIYFKGTGNFSQCFHSTIPLLNLTAACLKPPCSFGGYHQPGINFNATHFYGFSEYWYSLEDVLRLASTSRRYDAEQFVTAASQYCATKWTTLLSWYEKSLYPKADWNRFRLQCFKSAWVFTMLHRGLHFPVWYPHFHPTQLVQGQQVQWTLGALLFKARFFPLREVQQYKGGVGGGSHWPGHHHHHPSHPGWSTLRALYNNEYFLTACIVVVVLLVLLYLRRLKVHRYVVVKSDQLRHVPSMSYYMVPEEGGGGGQQSGGGDYTIVNLYNTTKHDTTDQGLRMII